VHGLRKIGCQMIFVDEAGRLSLNALDALVLVSDTARIMKWPLTIVIIGMDDLPVKIKLNERIYSRVHQKVCFEPYKPHETWDLLAALDPYFAGLDRNKSECKEQVALIHELNRGNPREIYLLCRPFHQHAPGTSEH
jgi:DNA transposition AAA+ family ATPase